MNYQKMLWQMMGVVLVVLFLVGCGGDHIGVSVETPTSEQGQSTSLVQAVETATSMPTSIATPLPSPTFTATSIPPTPTTSPPTSTPELPTPTSAPASNLSEGTVLVLGGLEADISSVKEAAILPGLDLEAQSGLKFVIVKLKIKEFQGEFNVENIVLETGAGEQYAVTGGMSINADGTEITLGFEVPQDEGVDALNLIYK